MRTRETMRKQNKQKDYNANVAGFINSNNKDDDNNMIRQQHPQVAAIVANLSCCCNVAVI